MGCGYMGCGTAINKISWAVFGALLALAAVLLAIGLAKVAPCTRAMTNCTKNDPAYVRDRDVCTAPFRLCARSNLIVAAAGVVALICGVLLLCFMCCCSRPPPPKAALQPVSGQPYGNMTGVVQMQGYPTAVPAGMPMMGQQQQQQQQVQQLQLQQSFAYTPFAQQGHLGQAQLSEPQLPQQFSHQANVPVTRY